MVGRHRIPEKGQHSSVSNIHHGLGLESHTLEIRWLAHVGGGRVPLEGVSGRRWQGLPALVAIKDAGVLGDKHLSVDRRIDGGLNLGSVGPNIGQEYLGA